MNFYYESYPTSLPNWITYEPSVYSFKFIPDNESLVGSRNIIYQACNPSNVCDTSKTFVLTVTNDCPKFVPAITTLPSPVYTLGNSGY